MIAVAATGLFVYNLKTYLEIRKNTVISRKEDRFHEVGSLFFDFSKKKGAN